MKSSKVQCFVLNSGGLSKVMMNNPDPQLIKPLGPTEDKLERDFIKPVGKKLPMNIENTGIHLVLLFCSKEVTCQSYRK